MKVANMRDTGSLVNRPPAATLPGPLNGSAPASDPNLSSDTPFVSYEYDAVGNREVAMIDAERNGHYTRYDGGCSVVAQIDPLRARPDHRPKPHRPQLVNS